METQCEEGKRPCNMIAAADVMPLVHHNIGAFALRQGRGQINSRTDQTHDKGRVNMVGEINALFKRYRADQPSTELNRLNGRTKQHSNHAR